MLARARFCLRRRQPALALSDFLRAGAAFQTVVILLLHLHLRRARIGLQMQRFGVERAEQIAGFYRVARFRIQRFNPPAAVKRQR